MIRLYRKSFDKHADRVEERLKDLVLAYETEIDEKAVPCYILEGDMKIAWGDSFEHWFRSLEQELTWSRSLSGDGCFIDPESGEPC
jgi:hypothetical protein